MSTDELFHRFYYSKPGWLGGTKTFHQICRRGSNPDGRVLEIGSGPTNETSRFLAALGRLSGIDISKEVLGNVHLADAKVYDGLSIPYPDETFDVCVSDWVLEHVELPEKHFMEVARILKPGGTYCVRTMNLWHYVAIASRLLPFKLHLLIANRIRAMAEDAHEPYPTHYRANTRRRIMALAAQSGLIVDEIYGMEPEPSYGRAHKLLFYPMMMYERFVNLSTIFMPFRVTIYAILKKPAL